MEYIKALIVLFFVLCTRCFAIDYCVVGAGPSGLQMGYFLERADRDYLIFERDPTPGWFFKVYPRHRHLISINKRFTGKQNSEFNMRHDWNSLLSDDEELLMTKYTKDFFPKADLLVQYFNDYATKLKLKIQYHTYIKNVSYDTLNSRYHIADQNKTQYDCKVLIMSTGLWVENIPKGVIGINHTEGYPTMSINPDDYEGQSVLIIGRGNSGFETANKLLQATNIMHMMSRTRVRFSWETHYVGDVRAVNDGPIDTYQLKSLDGQLEADITTMHLVKKEDGKIYITFGDESSESDVNLATRQGYDRILRCTGFKFDRSIFDKNCRPKFSKVNKKYPDITHGYESVTSKHMFFTGVTTHSLDWRRSAGGFVHGFRYTTRCLHHYLEWRYEGMPWPATVLPVTELMNYIIKRLNEGAGTYQMFSTLVDVIIFRDDKTIEYLHEVEVGMTHDLYAFTGRNFTRGIVVNLEYGKNFSKPGQDSFREDRATGEPQEAHTSNFLHPVLYYYKNGIPPLEDGRLPRPTRLHHVVEDFLTEWIEASSHVLPLRWFLEYCIGDDLRRFYADSCFEYAMIGMNVPLTCQEEYMKTGAGLPRPQFTSQY